MISAKAAALAVGLLSVSSLPSFAQWIFNKEENAFDPNKSTFIALTANANRYALAVRCIGGEISIKFLTPDTSVDQRGAIALNLLQSKLMLRVDQRPILELDIDLGLTDGKVGAEADNANQVEQAASQIMAATERVSAAIKLGDNVIHNVNFGSRASRNTVSRVLAGCKKN